MKKTEIIKATDFFSFVGLLVLISTGALLKYTLPPGSGGSSVWGLTRHEWGDVHFYISLSFLLLMSLHLLLHLKFIKKAVMGKASREHNYRLAIGLLGLIMLIVILIAPLVAPIEKQAKTGRGENYEYRE